MKSTKKPTNRGPSDKPSEQGLRLLEKPRINPDLSSAVSIPVDDPEVQDFLDQIEWMKIGTDIADYLLPLPDDLDLPR